MKWERGTKRVSRVGLVEKIKKIIKGGVTKIVEYILDQHFFGNNVERWAYNYLSSTY